MKRAVVIIIAVAVAVILLFPFTVARRETGACVSVSLYREGRIPNTPTIVFPSDVGITVTGEATEQSNILNEFFRSLSVAGDEWRLDVEVYRFDRDIGEYEDYTSKSYFFMYSEVPSEDMNAPTVLDVDIMLSPGIFHIFASTWYKSGSDWLAGGMVSERYELSSDYQVTDLG